MDLERASFFTECRPGALIHHPTEERPVPRPTSLQFYLYRIHPVGREQFSRVGRLEVDRRDPDRPTSSRPTHHASANTVRPAQPASRGLQVAVRDRRPNHGRRNRLTIVAYRIHDRHRKVPGSRQALHQLHVPGPPPPKPVIVPHHELAHRVLVTQPPDECLRVELRHHRRERHHDEPLDALRRHEIFLLRRQRQQLRSRRRIHDRERMRIERHKHARQTSSPGPPRHLREHRLVTAVHAIERAQREDGAAHESAATTTRGFRSSPTCSATASNSSPENTAIGDPPPASASTGTGRPWTTASRSFLST